MGKQAGKTPGQLSGKKELTKLIEAKITAGIKEISQDVNSLEEIKKLIRKASKAISGKLWKKAKTDDKPAVADGANSKPLTTPAKAPKKAVKKKAVKTIASSSSKKAVVKSPAKKVAVKRSKPSKPAEVKEASE